MKEDFITQVGLYFLWFSREKWWRSAAEEEEEAASRERQWAEHKGVRAASSFPFIKTESKLLLHPLIWTCTLMDTSSSPLIFITLDFSSFSLSLINNLSSLVFKSSRCLKQLWRWSRSTEGASGSSQDMFEFKGYWGRMKEAVKVLLLWTTRRGHLDPAAQVAWRTWSLTSDDLPAHGQNATNPVNVKGCPNKALKVQNV